MSLKDALKEKTQKVQRDGRPKMYAVRLDFQVTETRCIEELVFADSEEDAHQKAEEQFKLRPNAFVFYHTDYVYPREGSRHGIQNILSHITRQDIIVNFSAQQRKLIQCLMESNIYLIPSWRGTWELTNLSNPPVNGNKRVSSQTVNSLFRKGLLIPLAIRDISKEEIAIQKALGSLRPLDIFTLNTNQMKRLGIKLSRKSC
jgi:hypothetical protein